MNHTTEELQALLGERIRELRLQKNLTQVELARRASVERRQVIALEKGESARVHTLVAVMRALEREAWFDNVAVIPRTNPFALKRDATPRKRAGTPRKPKPEVVHG